MNYTWNWGIFLEPSPEGIGTYFDMLLVGLKWTIATGACAWVWALLFGSFIGVIRTLPNRWTVGFGNAYVELFRNIPLLVQLFLWYFVLPELVPAPIGLWLKQLPNASFFTAVVGIGFFMSARVAEQVRAGIIALPRGQSMAGLALGLTTAQTYRYVLLPMAFRIILPPLTSELTPPEKRRLEVARALATKPRLLLLDEVMTGLTPTEAQAGVELVRAIRKKGITVLMVEHVMEIVMPLVDRAVVLNFGKVLTEGKPTEVIRNPEVIKAYLGDRYANRH
jgi:glutamate/aspartate transport system permease protein